MKFILKLISILALVSIVGIVVLYFSLNKIVVKGVTTFGPQLTLTEVTLEESNISLFSGTGELKGFIIGNPKGFSSNDALTFDRIKVSIDVKSIFSDNILIKEILIDGPKISYELAGKKSNIKAILDNMNSLAKEEEKVKKTESETKGTEKKVIIDLLKITNGKIDLAVTALGGKGVSLGLSDLTVRDLGRKKGGLSLAEAASEIFNSLNKGVSGSVSISAGDVKQKAKNMIDGVNGLFGK